MRPCAYNGPQAQPSELSVGSKSPGWEAVWPIAFPRLLACPALRAVQDCEGLSSSWVQNKVMWGKSLSYPSGSVVNDLRRELIPRRPQLLEGRPKEILLLTVRRCGWKSQQRLGQN